MTTTREKLSQFRSGLLMLRSTTWRPQFSSESGKMVIKSSTSPLMQIALTDGLRDPTRQLAALSTLPELITEFEDLLDLLHAYEKAFEALGQSVDVAEVNFVKSRYF